MTDNLYNNLHRSTSGWDEDFLTEAFTHLLKYLQDHESDAAYLIINKLTGNLPRELGEDIDEISISTQLSTNFGIPDICIRHQSFLVLIEVKVDADFHSGQLSGYRRFLSESELPNVRLNTLTRYGQSGDHSAVDLAIRWNQVAGGLEKLRLHDPVAIYLRNEFVGFLNKRGVAMDKVEWDLVSGIKSMLSLLNMIVEAMSAVELKHDTATAGKNRQGFLRKHGPTKRIFVGIYLDDPSRLWVHTENCPLDNELQVSLGEIDNGIWSATLDLASEEVHFFARSKQSQLSCLEEFLRDSIEYADKLIKSTD